MDDGDFFDIGERSQNKRDASLDDGFAGTSEDSQAFEHEPKLSLLGEAQGIGNVVFAMGFDAKGNLAADHFAEEILGGVVLRCRVPLT